jgi:K+-transporting ATPase ATPase C chain
MLKDIRPAVTLLIAMTVITGLAYPLALTGIAGVLFPHQAEGSLVMRDGKPIGSELIGQNFASPRYFHGRPSATTMPDPKDATKTVPAPYNAANSAGSNLAPTSKDLVTRVAGDVAALKAEGVTGDIPADLVTTSASGLDPHISPQAARVQIARVAAARHVEPAKLQALVDAQTEGRLFGLIGEPRVNVLALNMALDATAP